MKDWERFESDMQELLGLSSTISSGNQAHDPSDGVDRRHHSETDFALMIDCKHTVKKSFSLNRKFLKDWTTKASSFGSVFALPIRFQDEHVNALGKRQSEDYIVLGVHDFVTLLDHYRATTEDS